MPRTPEEERAFKEAVDRHNARFGYARPMPPRNVVKKECSKPPSLSSPPPQKPLKKDWSVTICGKTTRSSDKSAPENIRIILEAEAKAAERGRQAIAELLQELAGGPYSTASTFEDEWGWVWAENPPQNKIDSHFPHRLNAAAAQIRCSVAV